MVVAIAIGISLGFLGAKCMPESAQLGIASQTLIDAMVFDIVFGIFAAAANLSMLQLDLVIQSGFIGLLDKDRLKKEPR